MLQGRQPMLVDAKDAVAEGVMRVCLRRADGSSLPCWAPGAHIDLAMAPGVVRQYSLCGDPDDSSQWTISVLHDPRGRGGSRFVYESLNVGDTVDVGGPRNDFILEEADTYFFVAGGIGITPILPMIRFVHGAGREWRLLYGGRRLSSMAFVEELKAYGDRVQLWPEDTHGLLPLKSELASVCDGAAIYCCGPEPLLQAVQRSCPPERGFTLHFERFAPAAKSQIEGNNRSFTVELAESGLSFEVPPDRSILEVLEEAGANVLSSCRMGTCGTCEVEVIEGVPDHRDTFLNEDEKRGGEVMLICQSRSCSPKLVLKL